MVDDIVLLNIDRQLKVLLVIAIEELLFYLGTVKLGLKFFLGQGRVHFYYFFVVVKVASIGIKVEPSFVDIVKGELLEVVVRLYDILAHQVDLRGVAVHLFEIDIRPGQGIDFVVRIFGGGGVLFEVVVVGVSAHPKEVVDVLDVVVLLFDEHASRLLLDVAAYHQYHPLFENSSSFVLLVASEGNVFSEVL